MLFILSWILLLVSFGSAHVSHDCGALFGIATNSKIAADSTFDPNLYYWNFPSDHLPVVANVRLFESAETYNVITWNVLNSNYLHHIKSGGQGLNSSLITEDLTRSERIAEILRELIAGVNPAILALQEVDNGTLDEIKIIAAQHSLDLFIAANPLQKNGEFVDFGVVLVAKSLLKGSPEQTVHFQTSEGHAVKYIQSINLTTRGGVKFRISNVHRQFDDSNVFPAFVSQKSTIPYLVLGDLNLDDSAIRNLLKRHPLLSLMQSLDGYFSHVDVNRQLTNLSHVLYSQGMQVQHVPRLASRSRLRFDIRLRSTR